MVSKPNQVFHWGNDLDMDKGHFIKCYQYFFQSFDENEERPCAVHRKADVSSIDKDFKKHDGKKS